MVSENSNISIHTALAGCDYGQVHGLQAFQAFQSTQPSQAVTVLLRRDAVQHQISIHTALAGCDLYVRLKFRYVNLISIHTALAGCDRASHSSSEIPNIFQSTQPSQAVTDLGCRGDHAPGISIHTALAGCDSQRISGYQSLGNFNPHSPRRL